LSEYTKPLPVPDIDSQEFWEGCRRHELLLQRCTQCHTFRYPPRPVCPSCFSAESTWEKTSGQGEVYTFSIVRRALGPAWETDIPYVIAIIRLDEGVQIVSNIVDCRTEDVRIGMKVEVVFDDVTERFTLPKFRAITLK
jgi:uncharacterized protein